MATTITAEATAADLLAELRDLVNRYDGTETLDDARELLDAVTQRLRRARGRINRIVKASAPPVSKVEPKPAAVPAPAATKPALESPARATVVEKPPASAPAAAPVRPRPAPRRITAAHVALAVIASWWSTVDAHACYHGRRVRRVAKRTRRGAGRFAAAVRSTLARIGSAS